ncbi:ATP-dependent helicase HrpB [Rhodobacterales bacterium 52_120_T64]|nr:ATP-dependent helicase HrpB [Rhodobacterales bacterium 52_120_T64]
MTALPVEAVLPELLTAMRGHGMAVLQAPPGAGKTTRVPLCLLENGLYDGLIVMLEPRRVAARAAAERLAQQLGEKVGETVGYRIKGESRVGPKTRIEVVTEGILTRILQRDPELSGIDCVIFDEFHERSLNADLGLALCLEAREVLRNDLNLLVMSATLDAGPVAELMGGAPMVTSTGRSFPVETHWLAQPWVKPNRRGPWFEDVAADLVTQVVAKTDGGVLVFLPGAGEIRRVEAKLNLSADCTVMPLFGGLPFAKQREVLAPRKGGRKVVLATAIAETSLTIPDIRAVVDCGRARRARFDAGSGMSRLVTERVTKAEAEQRRGRAGRVSAGVCYRMWTKGEEGGMAPFPPAEIESTDLAGLVLELAVWGADTPLGMAFLTQPPDRAFAEAQSLLNALGALKDGRITAHGKVLARLPMHPRLGHMLVIGATYGSRRLAATLAALIAERDPVGGRSADMTLRLEAVADPSKFERERPYRADRGAISAIKAEIKRFEKLVPMKAGAGLSAGALLSLAYPDRIALRRKGDEARFLLSGGKGAIVDAGDALANGRMLVAVDLDGDLREARLRLGAMVSEAEIRDLHEVREVNVCEWSRRDRAVVARQRVMLDALMLEDRHWKNVPDTDVASAMVEGVRELGLGTLDWSKSARLLKARVEWLRARGAEMPDMSDSGLIDGLERWLQPFLGGVRRTEGLKKVDVSAALKSMLDWDAMQLLDRLAPAAITAPTGTRLAVDYGAEQPSVSVRLQEMFGLNQHPVVGPDRLPVLIELLSPAQRPVQTTADLPGFWVNSYADVRKDMRGRYPRHPWPEDPTAAEPTRRVKPRKA